MARARPARFQFTWLQIVTHLGALAPLAVMIWDGFHNGLTYNPIQSLTFRTGKTALVLLVLSLACTPLNSVFGFREAIKLRRPLGVYAFFYALGHFCIFLFDYMFDPQLLFQRVRARCKRGLINEPDRAAGCGVARTFAPFTVVLEEPALNVGGDAGVERPVGASDNVKPIGH